MGLQGAGETIYATALARDAETAAVENLPLTAILKRPDGVEYSRAQMADAGAGGHVFALPVGGSAPRGVWTLEVYADLEAAALTSQTVLVEDFLPERIDFTLGLADQPIRLGDVPQMTVDAKYLFGAPGADLAIEGEVLLRAAKELEAWPGYVFGRYDAPFDAQLSSFGDIRTDSDGKAVVDLSMPEVEDPGRPLEMRATVRVAEGSGRPVERKISKLLAPSSDLIGIKPEFDGVVAEGAEASFNLIGINAETKPAPMKVKWSITRIETNYQWYQTNSSGIGSRSPAAARSPKAPPIWATPRRKSRLRMGEYELLVERTDGASAASSTNFYAAYVSLTQRIASIRGNHRQTGSNRRYRQLAHRRAPLARL